MLPSVVEVGSPGLYLSKSRGFLSIKDRDGHKTQVPLDNIGVLVITSPQATLSTTLMNTLSERGIVAVLCNAKHQPSSFLYPFKPHEEMTGRLLDQIKASPSLKKRMWQSIIKSKITHQALILQINDSEKYMSLGKLASEVLSGDKDNKEAHAARVYWQALFGKNFRRKPREDGLNSVLDFGYGILRSAILRTIAGLGINPSLGLEHISRRNPFCLADDLIEPFRPIVDMAACYIKDRESVILDARLKRILAGLLTVPLETSRGKTPLIRSMGRMAETLVRTYSLQKNLLEIPRFPKDISEAVLKLWQDTD